MRLETIHPREMGAAEAARWRAFHLADINLASPYFTPEWATLVGRARTDARVCLIGDGEGFLGVQRLSRFAAMGLGAPIADYQGVVGRADLDIDAPALCRALKVGRIDLTHVPAGQKILAGAAQHSDGSWIAETSGGREFYEAGLRLARAEFVRQSDKKRRKLEREHGEVRFGVSTAREDFETLLTWKRTQLKASGQPSIWDTRWVRQVIDGCFEAHETQFGGALFTLHAGERLIAANFCLRSAHAMNMWIIAHDDAYEAYSPGVQLGRWAVGWAGDHGIAEVDFGPGDYRYKRQLSTKQRQLEWGAAAGLSWSGLVRRTEYAMRARVERLPSPRLAALPGKAMRRLDLMRALAA